MTDQDIYDVVFVQIVETRMINMALKCEPLLICTNITRPMWDAMMRVMEAQGFFHYPMAGPKPPGVPEIMFNGSSIKIIERDEFWAVSYAI